MNASNRGSVALPFAQLFADTVIAHGGEWARRYYLRNGMREWEFRFWAVATSRQVAEGLKARRIELQAREVTA